LPGGSRGLGDVYKRQPKYYDARGWDGEGRPTSATKERLGL
jgi:aldehyde:ferredoxin oxidoreductase